MEEFFGVQVVVRFEGSVRLAYVRNVSDVSITVEWPDGGAHSIAWNELCGATGFRRAA
jgi:hypothetical protein